MSITEPLDTKKIYNKPFHWRNDSGELDVFEAARYFSGGGGGNEIPGRCTTFPQKLTAPVTARRSLDMPTTRSLIPPQTYVMEKQISKEKKNKHPSSPGGKLAHFLNSLFNQASLKKKKTKTPSRITKNEEETPGGGRRKIRSSISHFRISSSNKDSKSLYSSSNSGFRTPPSQAITPTKSHKDLKSIADYKQIISVQKLDGDVKRDYSSSWLDEKLKLSNYGYLEKSWADMYPTEENEFRKFSNVDDGADSESSSDLFDLPNHELDFCSSDLPVYETTHIDNIKRPAITISTIGKE